MKQKVLVVDDDPLVLRAIARVLRSSYEVRTATSTDQALEEIACAAPDVIVSDLQMEPRSGEELFRAVAIACPLARRVLLSGAAIDHLERLVSQGVAHASLDKACSVEQLLAAIAGRASSDRLSDFSAAILDESDALKQVVMIEGAIASIRAALAASEEERHRGRGVAWSDRRHDAAESARRVAAAAMALADDLDRVRFVVCPACHGSGSRSPCPECRGRGELLRVRAAR